jgi:predicted RNase H-like nuclease (RuvC/YqgF family)
VVVNQVRRKTEGTSMNTAGARKVDMSSEDRIGKIESDVSHILSDVAETKTDNKSLKIEVHELRVEFHSFRTEVAKEFGLVRYEMADFRVETAKEFGSVRNEIESVKTTIERAKLWFVVTILLVGIPALGTLFSIFNSLWHVLRR